MITSLFSPAQACSSSWQYRLFNVLALHKTLPLNQWHEYSNAYVLYKLRDEPALHRAGWPRTTAGLNPAWSSSPPSTVSVAPANTFSDNTLKQLMDSTSVTPPLPNTHLNQILWRLPKGQKKKIYTSIIQLKNIFTSVIRPTMTSPTSPLNL